MIGRVVSAKLQKTATVLVERVAMHPLYKKTYIQSKKYLVEDPLGVKNGDMVEIVKVKPVSKNKHFRIVKIVGKNLAKIVEAEQKQKAEEVIAEVMPEEKEENKQSLPPQSEDRVEGIGSAEEKKKRVRKEKVVPKP